MGEGLQVHVEEPEGESVEMHIGLNHLVVGILEVPGLDMGEWILTEDGYVQVLIFPAIGYLVRVGGEGVLDGVVGQQISVGSFLQADKIRVVGFKFSGCSLQGVGT